MTKIFDSTVLDFDRIGSLSDWNHRLRASDSRLHKEDVIKQAYSLAILGDHTAIGFLSFANMAYDPYLTFGVRHIDDLETGSETTLHAWREVHQLMTDLVYRNLTGNRARAAIAATARLFNAHEWEFCRAVLQKDLRSGVSDKTLNKILKGTPWQVPVFECQLATDSRDRPEMKGKKRLEIKLDGVRVLAHVMTNSADVVCYSRNGKIFNNFEHIQQQISSIARAARQKLRFSNSFILDGEVVSDSFQALMKQAHRKSNVNNSDATFYIFDAFPFAALQDGHENMQQSRRLERLEEIRTLLEDCPNIKLLEGLNVDLDLSEGRDQFNRFCNDAITNGFEGVMIKNLEAPYICKRSTYWMKWKPTITVDLEVVDVEQGTGRNSERLGALVCRGTDQGRDISVNVGSGFSDHDRTNLWNNRDLVIGSTVEIMADVVSQNQDGTYSLRFPRFVRFRDDK